MLRDIRKNKVFNRRMVIASGAKSALSLALISRLGYLQLWKHKEYSIQSDSNRIRPLINPAPRGIIFDRNGIALAQNIDNYRLLFYLENRSHAHQIIDELAAVLELDEENKKLFFAKIKNASRKTVISLIDDLSWYDLSKIETNFYKLPGISIESGMMRNYPFPRETAHFLGYVSLPAEKEIEENEQSLFMHPDFRIGKTGIERSFDETLRGKYGIKYVEVNAYGTPVRTLSQKSYTEGARVHLTIDTRIQKFVTERIKDHDASALVMDVKTGEILAYASSPSFDPNKFVEGVSREYWKELSTNPSKPLNNRPIAASYPPGSTFKMMAAIAGLELGINPNRYINCPGHYQLGRRTFHCWKDGGHGRVNLLDAIAQSCDVYFFTIGNSIGIDKIAEVAKRFGYGEKFDISLYGAKSGLVPSTEWKRSVLKQPWTPGDTLNATIGQGFVLATPLQMAVAVSRIANGGVPIKPYLVKNRNIYDQYNVLKANPIASPEHLQLVIEGMNRVVNSPGGTAYYHRIDKKGYEMAGKTGTAQVISKRESELSKAKAAIKTNQSHAIFVGFAPVADPRYAVSVMVEHGQSGSHVAAPIGKDIMLTTESLNDSYLIKPIEKKS